MNKELEALADEYAKREYSKAPLQTEPEAYYIQSVSKESFIAGYKAKEEAGEEDAVDGWISVEDRLPEAEGKYQCCNFYKQIISDDYTYMVFVSNFKFYRWRTTNEIFVDSDGITGAFSNNAGYSDMVTHWQPLPKPPIH